MYNSLEEMNENLINILVHYNLYRRHKPKERTQSKNTFNAVKKWFELDPGIIKENRSNYKINSIFLSPKS